MEWTDISITVAKRDADTAEAIATMVANGGIYIEDYSDLEQQAWEIAHVDLIEQELLDKPRDVVIVHMYLAPDENPAEILPLFEERLKNSGIDYQQFARKMRSRGYTIDEIKAMFDAMRGV